MPTKKRKAKSVGEKGKKKAAIVGDSAEEPPRKSSTGLESEMTSANRRNNRKNGSNNSNTNHAKKATITLALDDIVVEEIRREAKEFDQSLNAKINAILRKYVFYWRMIEMNGAAIIPRQTHELLLNDVDEQKYAEEMKKIGRGLVASAIEQRAIPLTLESIARFVYGEVCVNGGSIRNYSLYVDERDGKTCLFFRHDYNEKWSRILAEAFPDLLKELFHYSMQTKVFPNSLEIKILDEIKGQSQT